MRDRIDLPGAEETVRMLVATRPQEGIEDNVVPLHMLAEHLVKTGRYEEAIEVETPVLKWILAKPHLVRDSPQAINAKRFIAKALWFQVLSMSRLFCSPSLCPEKKSKGSKQGICPCPQAPIHSC